MYGCTCSTVRLASGDDGWGGRMMGEMEFLFFFKKKKQKRKRQKKREF